MLLLLFSSRLISSIVPLKQQKNKRINHLQFCKIIDQITHTTGQFSHLSSTKSSIHFHVRVFNFIAQRANCRLSIQLCSPLFISISINVLLKICKQVRKFSAFNSYFTRFVLIIQLTFVLSALKFRLNGISNKYGYNRKRLINESSCHIVICHNAGFTSSSLTPNIFISLFFLYCLFAHITKNSYIIGVGEHH